MRVRDCPPWARRGRPCPRPADQRCPRAQASGLAAAPRPEAAGTPSPSAQAPNRTAGTGPPQGAAVAGRPRGPQRPPRAPAATGGHDSGETAQGQPGKDTWTRTCPTAPTLTPVRGSESPWAGSGAASGLSGHRPATHSVVHDPRLPPSLPSASVTGF